MTGPELRYFIHNDSYSMTLFLLGGMLIVVNACMGCLALMSKERW